MKIGPLQLCFVDLKKKKVKEKGFYLGKIAMGTWLLTGHT